MQPLETSLFVVPPGDRNASIVARHYGFDGLGGANFQRTGYEFGLSRERIRQIVSGFDPRDQILLEGCAALDLVIAFIAALLPAAAAEVETRLQAAGLTMTRFRIEGIVNVARLLGRSLPFQMGSLNKKRFVIPVLCPKSNDIVARACARVRRHGMATITDFVNDAVPGKMDRGDTRLIEAILGSQPDFRWLDRRSGWFWLADTSRNRTLKRVRKMLAVANPLTVEELRAGLGRSGSTLVPETTLLSFCSQIEGLSVRGDTIHASPNIERDEVLNRTERDIYRLLSAHGGWMSNKELVGQAKSLGIKRPTFYLCVTHSPIVVRIKGSHCRLIGSTGQSGNPMPFPLERSAARQ